LRLPDCVHDSGRPVSSLKRLSFSAASFITSTIRSLERACAAIPAARGEVCEPIVLVHQHDVPSAALDEVERSRGAEPAGADHDDVSVVHHLLSLWDIGSLQYGAWEMRHVRRSFVG
jgi:hypothetical protein